MCGYIKVNKIYCLIIKRSPPAGLKADFKNNVVSTTVIKPLFTSPEGESLILKRQISEEDHMDTKSSKKQESLINRV